MGIFSMIAAIEEFLPAIGICTGIDGVIAPFPYKSAGKPVMPVDNLEIILQIPGAIAHGMAVFAQQIGPLFIL